MCRKILVIVSAVTFLLGVSKLSFAQARTEHEHGVTETSKAAVSGEAVNVGNKICPVSGENIKEKTKATYEYQGKIYNFCCPMCIDEFKKNPEKYIKKIEQESQAESKGQAAHEGHEMGSMQESETMHQGMHH